MIPDLSASPHLPQRSFRWNIELDLRSLKALSQATSPGEKDGHFAVFRITLVEFVDT